MKAGTAQKISNAILSCAAGFASFLFSLTALLYLTEFDQKIVAALVAGAFCLLVSYVASERPNSESARALAALSDRLLAVEDGDLVSPAPASVQRNMPKLAAAVDSLFAEVRASIENAHALGMYDPVTSLPNRLHFRSEADKLLSEALDGAQIGDAVRRPRPLQDGQRQPRPRPRRPAADHGRQPPAGRRQRRIHRQRPRRGRCSRASPATSSPCSSREIESVAEIERIARRVVLAISEPFELCSHSVDIGASIGVAISPDHGTSIEALMRAADIAMYRAKSSGGGQHCLFNAELAAEHQQKIETEKALTEAVQRGEFVLAFQPQMSLVTGEVAGAEALLRWNHPRDGLRLPGTFIPIAERTGVIAEIGDWVIGEVASDRSAAGSATASTAGSRSTSARARSTGADFFARLRQAFADAERAAVADRARIHRKRGDGSQRRRCSTRSPRCAPTARRSRSTISAPAIRTSRGCARCRSTGSSSTRR